MKYFIFYHDQDHDGFASMYLVNKYLEIKRNIIFFENRSKREHNMCDYSITKLLRNMISRTKDKSFLSIDEDSEIINIPYNYGYNISEYINEMEPDDCVVFVDCLAYQEENPPVVKMLQKLKQKNLYIIDHHRTALDWIEEHLACDHINLLKPVCIYESAVAIVYKELFDSTNSSDDSLNERSVPMWIDLLSMYDTWCHTDKKYNWDYDIAPFQQWIKYGTGVKYNFSIPSTARDLYSMIEEMNEYDYDHATDVGAVMIDTLRQRNIAIWKKNGVIGFAKTPEYRNGEEYKVAFCYDYLQSSKLFDDAISEDLLSADDIDLYIIASHDFKRAPNKDGFELSIYSKKEEFPASELAKCLGGGGHVGAAGTPVGTPRFLYVDVYTRPSDAKEINKLYISNTPYHENPDNDIELAKFLRGDDMPPR